MKTREGLIPWRENGSEMPTKFMKTLNPSSSLRAFAFTAILTLVALLGFGASSHAAPPRKNGRELLAEHHTVAQFTGVAFQKCRGLTSLCPDKCGSSGDFASFKILGYVLYKKTGEYGDPMQESFMFQVEDNMKNAKVTPELRAAVTALKKDDYVLLSWNHDYVTNNGGSSPERPVTKVSKITKEEAEKLLQSKK
jgi:hypothetical protein